MSIDLQTRLRTERDEARELAELANCPELLEFAQLMEDAANELDRLQAPINGGGR